MNTARRLTQLTMLVATLAAAFVAQAGDAPAAAPRHVTLDTVVVTGHRALMTPAVQVAVAALPTVMVTGRRPAMVEMAMAQLPRVTVTGHRTADPATLLAQKNARNGNAKAAV